MLIVPLLAAALAAAPAVQSTTTPIFNVALEFECGKRQTIELLALPGGRTLIDPPKACAAPGPLALELSCGSKACEGALFVGERLAATVRGPRTGPFELVSTTRDFSFEWLRFRSVRDSVATMSGEDLASQGLVFSFRFPEGDAIGRMMVVPADWAPVEVHTLRWKLRLEVRITRTAPNAAHLEVRRGNDTIVDDEMPIPTELVLNCKASKLPCPTNLLLGLERQTR